MDHNRLGRRQVLQGMAAVGAVATAAHPARAAGPVQMISHRYPALEHWAAKMKTA